MLVIRQSIVGICLATIAFVGFGNFSSLAFGSGVGNMQQAVIVAAWAIISGICLTMRTSRVIDRAWAALFCLSLYYVWMSSLWSADPLASAGKATVLACNAVGALVLCSRMPLETILLWFRRGLLTLLVLCVAVSLLWPAIGQHNDWQHAGKWRGIFEQKQLLGSSAVVAGLLYLLGERGLRRAIPVGIAVLCVLGSQSRNSLVLLLVVASLHWLSLRFRLVAAAAALLPIALTGFALCLLLWMVATNAVSLDWIDEGLTITGRTYIWNFAMQAWQEAALLGYGVNGFWADRLVAFRAEYGWALDNFHSGYLAILVEGGLVLYMAVLGLAVVQTQRLLRLRGTATRHAMSAGFLLIYPIYFAVLNLSETFWFRSTSAYFSLFIVAAACARAVPAGAHARPSPARLVSRRAEQVSI